MGKSYAEDEDWGDEPTQSMEFTGTLFDLDGNHLASNVVGVIERIDGLPVRFEGEFGVVGITACVPNRVYWSQVLLVADDGTQMVFQCGVKSLEKGASGVTTFWFTSDSSTN